ncbi:MAG: tetratricopeptide repeat protein [Endomicrobium sp.]|jgi:predicted negative regulator of RcsB-dependent stress response|nr:tetratricopeptide repeat protein [Endomicrobium sp.]
MQSNFLKKIPDIIARSAIKVLAIIIFVVLLVIVVIFIYCLKVYKINNSSSLDLAKAYSAFANRNQQLGIAMLDEVIAKYPKTPAAYQAKLFRADMLMELQFYDEALNILKETESKAKPETIKPLALVRIIYIYDSKKDYFNAITVSKKFIDKYPDHFLIRDIYLNLAEYYLGAGFKDEAVKTFNEVLISFPATQEAEKAQKRINEIK